MSLLTVLAIAAGAVTVWLFLVYLAVRVLGSAARADEARERASVLQAIAEADAQRERI